MEINTLMGIGGNAERTTTRAVSTIAARPVQVACLRTVPAIDTYSQGGVGSDAVRRMWQIDLSMTDPKFYAHKFTTRQGPPICSPPA